MVCRTCAGDGLEYDGIERGIVTCPACAGTGTEVDPVRTTLDDRAQAVAQRVIDEMCRGKQRPRDVVERALVAFALSERKNS